MKTLFVILAILITGSLYAENTDDAITKSILCGGYNSSITLKDMMSVKDGLSGSTTSNTSTPTTRTSPDKL